MNKAKAAFAEFYPLWKSGKYSRKTKNYLGEERRKTLEKRLVSYQHSCKGPSVVFLGKTLPFSPLSTQAYDHILT